MEEKKLEIPCGGSVEMRNGNVLSGDKISQNVRFIINRFAEEHLTSAEAKIILEHTEQFVEEASLVRFVG